jgi:hypothetical protein
MLAELRDWIKAPFQAPVSGYHLFLIVGFIIVAIALWWRILYYMAEGIREVEVT